jgi:hypothetical protein
MRHHSRAALSALVVALVLVGATNAFAATPSQIYQDYADNGRLDKQYSKSDLQRALKSAVVQGYGKPNVTTEVKPAIQRQLREQGRVGGLPFTGVDLALMTAGGLVLVGVGLGLRRVSRQRA